MNKDLKVSSQQAQKPTKISSTKRSNSSKPKQQDQTSTKHEIKLLPDEVTNNLKNLRQVRFLAQDNKEHGQQVIDAKPFQEKASQLAHEYLARQQNVNSNILKQVNQSKLVYMEVLKKNKLEQEAEAKRKAEFKKNVDPNSLAGLRSGLEDETENKIADGFVRSERNVQLRAKDSIDSQLHELQQEKTQLVQKVNEALEKLDRFNSRKRELSSKLIEQIQFVRDLQKATGGAGLDDLNSIASVDLTQEYKREQEIHQQLDDQLTRAEQERLQLLEKLQLYVGDKEVVVIQKDGQRTTFKVTQVNITKLLGEISELKSEIVQLEDQIQQMRTILFQTEDELSKQENLKYALQHERDQILHRTSDIQIRYDQAVLALQNDQQRVHQVHKLHVKLLSMRILEETMQKILARTRYEAFGMINDVVELNQKKFRGVQIIKKLIIGSQYRKQKFFLQKWFKIACDPVRLDQLSTAVPVFFDKFDMLVHFYSKWRSLFLKKTHVNISKKSACNRIFTSAKQISLKQQSVLFQFWRMKLQSQRTKLIALRKIMISSVQRQTYSAITKWKRFEDSQNIQTRILSLGVSLNCKTVLSQVLNVFQQYALKSRIKNRSRLVRTWKNLRKNVIQNKFDKVRIQQILVINQNVKTSLQQQIFSHLRLNKEKRKLKKALVELHGNVAESIKSWQEWLKRQNELAERRKKLRAIQAVIIKPQLKRIAYCFDKWKTQLIQEKYRMSTEICVTIIKMYKRRLFDAWSQWIFQRDKITLARTLNQDLNFKGEILSHEKLKQLALQKIEDHKQIQLSKARACFRRVFTRIFLKYLCSKFRIWQRGSQFLAKQQYFLKKVIQKIRICFVRQAFTKYQVHCKQFNQEILIQKRVEEYKSRLDNRMIRVIFQSIRLYSAQHCERVAQLSSIFKRFDKQALVLTLLKWHRFTKLNREKSLFAQEKSAVGKIQVLTETFGELSDKNKLVLDEVAKLQQILKTESKHALQKWVLRFHRGGMRYGFKTWLHQSNNKLHKVQFVRFLKNQLTRGSMRLVLSMWKNGIGSETNHILRLRINKKLAEIHKQEYDMICQKRSAEHEREKLVSSLQKVNVIRALAKKQLDKVVRVLEDKQRSNFHIKRIRFLFLRWREFSKMSKKSMQILTSSIMKVYCQTALNNIRNFNATKKLFYDRQKGYKRLDDIQMILDLRFSFGSWKTYLYKQEIFERKQIEEVISRKMQSSEIISQKIVTYHKSLLYNNRKKTYKTQLINAWNYWTYQSFQQKQESNQLESVVQSYILKRAVLKIYQRTKATLKARYQVQKLKASKRMSVLKNCYGAFRKSNRLDSQMASKIISFNKALENFKKLFALRQIKYSSFIQNIRADQNLDQACRHTFKTIDRLLTNRYRFAFTSLQKNSILDKQGYFKFNRCLKNCAGLHLRSYFQKWLSNSKKITVVDYCENGLGKINIQAWQQRWKYRILREIVQEDGQEKEQIQSILKNDKDKNLGLIKRAVIRLMIFSDQDLKLLPIYFDRLKMYVATRKYWKHILRIVNRHVNRLNKEYDIAKSFYRWRRRNANKVSELVNTTLYNLQNKSYEDSKQLEILTEKVEESNEIFIEFSAQRDALFDGYLKSQKLAFANTKAIYHRAAQKSIMRLADYGNEQLRRKIDQALQENLYRIEALKARIGKLEDGNIAVSLSNDESRSGALVSIATARNVEALQSEIQQMSLEEQANNAFIRKLIEDQNWLKQKVEQEEEKLKYPQLKLNKNMQSNFASPLNRENYQNVMNGGNEFQPSRELVARTQTRVVQQVVPQISQLNSRRNSPLRLKVTIHK